MTTRLIAYLLPLITLSCLLSCQKNVIGVPDSPYPIANDSFTVTTLAEGFTIPYGIAVLSEDEFYLTDRIGKLFHYQAGTLTEIKGLPEVVTFGTPGLRAIMHGGLMELSLHPDYANNGWVYVAYLEAADGLAKVSRFRVKDSTATEIQNIFTTRHQNYTGNGMRIVWQDSTHFFLNVGNSDLCTHENPVLFAQDLEHDAGKIHRLLDDGSIPADNPVLPGDSKPGTIWSYGHRDVQGLQYDAATGTLYGIEHGPQGGDEFNIIEKGKNYGWPLFSYGINYDGIHVSSISEDSAATFTVFPEHYWTVPTHYGGQAIAPACLLKVENSTIAEWDGHFLVGSLAFRRLMKYNHTSKETFGLPIEGRVRTLAQLPSGDILALIERNDLRKTNGKLVRISR